jgi:hypothetical protein
MGNVLALGAYHMLARRQGPHPFLAGFEVCGSGAVLGFMAWCWASPKTVVILIMPLYLVWVRLRPISKSGTSILVVGGLSFLLPQLLIATLGGLTTRRLARRRATAGSGGSARVDDRPD